MIMIGKLLHKIKRKWMKLRLQPIRVFCFHHVSDAYDASYMWEEDWTNTDVLKNFIKKLQQNGYIFISLPEVHAKMAKDVLRNRKYAVLTADDGFKSLLNIVPWLIEQNIPITLFVNPRYIVEDGIGENVQLLLNQTQSVITNKKLYLSMEDIQSIKSPLVTFASHGYEHFDEWNISRESFKNNLEKCVDALQKHFPNMISYYAHTYGHILKSNDKILLTKGIIPIYTSGGKNYNNTGCLDRELISNERIINGKV